MDYVVGSVAALITGNVTPNRPRLMKRALTPTKHQPSPNVTPKSEFVEDRSIFLSPSMQKKKAIVKKSPKRIFQNPDLETTENGEGNSSISSPKADKVKKHLKEELEGDSVTNKSMTTPKSPKSKANNKRDSISMQEINKSVTEQEVNDSTPKKKKKKQNSEPEITEKVDLEPTAPVSTEDATPVAKSPKKRKQRRKSVVDTDSNKENDSIEKVNEPEEASNNEKSPKKQKNKTNNQEPKEKSNEISETNQNTNPKKKNKRRKKKSKAQTTAESSETKDNVEEETNKENIQKVNQVAPKKKNKRRKKSKAQQNKPEIMETDEQDAVETENETAKSKNAVNPNAVTDKESDSEHESDDEIESENEEINKKVLESEKPEVSSDEEDEEPKAEKKEVEKKEEGVVERNTEEEIKRTLFVGNVLFNAKCKKEIKKIFNKHGQIETIRIRTVPIKDGRYTPKMALIKNELHPERTTVNVYIKYADIESVDRALIENNTVLNGHHLRVSRSSSTGAEHDPRCSVFIGNLPFAMEDEALRAKFEKCGEIHSVRIVRDKKTNAGKGFGYVNFESKDGVELALALTEEDLTVKNRILRVKRCTQVTKKKQNTPNNQGQQQRGGFRPGNNQMNQPRGNFRPGNNQGDQQRGNFRPGNNQGNQQRGNFRPGNNQGDQQRGNFRGGNNQGDQRGGFRAGNNQAQERGRSTNRSSQGDRQRAFGGGNNQQRGGFNKFGSQKNLPQKDEEGREGAHRRVMNKRKSLENAGGGDGPPNKKQKNIDQPNREKKTRKEFVGMTAEKKKKRKVDKGQKKKKALSEILTK